MAALPIGQGGEQDSLVEIRRGGRRGQRTEQLDELGGAAELGRAGDAAGEVFTQRLTGVGRQFVEEEGIDQAARGRTVKRLARVGRLHTLVMTRQPRKVAGAAMDAPACRIRHGAPRARRAARRSPINRVRCRRSVGDSSNRARCM